MPRVVLAIVAVSVGACGTTTDEAEPDGQGGGAPGRLAGTAWVLTDVADTAAHGPADDGSHTLRFDDDGRFVAAVSCGEVTGVTEGDGPEVRFAQDDDAARDCGDATTTADHLTVEILDGARDVEVSDDALSVRTDEGASLSYRADR